MDGQPQAGGASDGLHGIDAVKQALGLHTAQRRRAVGKCDRAVRQQADRQIAVRVLHGVAEDVVEDPPQRGGVQMPGDLLLRHPDLRRDALCGQRAVKPGEALLQYIVQADGLPAQLLRRGGDDGVAEQLLRQAAHGVCPFPDHGKIAPGLFRLRLLLKRSRYPQTAVSGVRRSWEMFVMAVVSSSLPACSRRRSLRSARSWWLICAASV